MLQRYLRLPPAGTETFFLWGPRQTGKTTLLGQSYPGAFRVDLLRSAQFRRYVEDPGQLAREIQGLGARPFVVIDEVQKVPDLLDEVHWMHESLGVRFALCGSSARKVKAGRANLLGGRALRYELRGLVSTELGAAFNLQRMLNNGYLPRHYLSANPRKLLESYVADYLMEEVAAEGLVRNLPSFSGFLSAAALSDTEPVNCSAIARDVGVSSKTVAAYFDILVDTLQGRWLPASRSRPKRRVIAAPKFYFSDVGVVNHLARRGRIEPGSELFGKAFENWVHHEILAYNGYAERMAEIGYWRLASGIEVDFIVDDMRLALEAKASRRIRSDELKGLRQLVEDHPRVGSRVVVCLAERSFRTEDDIEVLTVGDFRSRLWSGQLV